MNLKKVKLMIANAVLHVVKRMKITVTDLLWAQFTPPYKTMEGTSTI